MINFSELVKSTWKYDLSVFSKESIERLENSIFEKNGKYFLKCIKRQKDIQVTGKPEEIIRQLMLDKLIHDYQYPIELLDVEYTVSFGREKKFADIVILNKSDKTTVYCVLEIKKANAKDWKDQLKSYTNATWAPLAVWTNWIEINYYERLNPNYFEPLSDIPNFHETIDDVKDERFTYLELMQKDRLQEERKTLKSIIQELEDEVLANAWVDVFEEVFKLIFIKLYDEMESAEDRHTIEQMIKINQKQHPERTNKEVLAHIDNDYFRALEFRSRGDAFHTKEVINTLFKRAKNKRPWIFEAWEPLRITDENHLQICVASLQNVKLFNSNLQVIDEAFEYLVNKSAKWEKWQFFTPRNVIDMCAYMINPQPHEYMIDTACWSCWFTVHTLFNVWNKLVNQWKANFHNFSNQALTAEQREFVDHVFWIDFDEKSVRVARTLNMIAWDWRTNVLHLNTLDYTRREEKLKDQSWFQNYWEWYYRLMKHCKNPKEPKEFDFDIIMANPPFAWDIKDSRLLAEYAVSFDDKGKKANAVSRDVLFIERNLDFLKPGGRMAIVLPQGRFNNSSDERIRKYIMERARLIAVVGLDNNTFKPHTWTKTSVLFVQKRDEDKNSPTYNPKLDDYEIFMAVSECTWKDNSWEEIYEKYDNGERKLDEHGHLIQHHDLEEIAKAFEKRAKEQKLSFWK